LGVRQSSFYKHINGVDGLHRSLAVQAKNELSEAVVQIATDVLAGYDLHDDDAIDATRVLRSTLHGSSRSRSPARVWSLRPNWLSTAWTG
jgi:hypothetical protein